MICTNPQGAWLLHPHGLGRSSHIRRRQTLDVDPQWVATGPNKNLIKIAATRLAKKIDLNLCEQEYEALIQVFLGKIRRTMTPVFGELPARDMFPRGPEPGEAPTQVRPQFSPTRFMLTEVGFRMHYPVQPRGYLQRRSDFDPLHKRPTPFGPSCGYVPDSFLRLGGESHAGGNRC